MNDQKIKDMTKETRSKSNGKFIVTVVLTNNEKHVHEYPTYLSMQKAKSTFIRMANRMKSVNVKDAKSVTKKLSKLNTDLVFEVYDPKTERLKTVTRKMPQIKSVVTNM